MEVIYVDDRPRGAALCPVRASGTVGARPWVPTKRANVSVRWVSEHMSVTARQMAEYILAHSQRLATQHETHSQGWHWAAQGLHMLGG